MVDRLCLGTAKLGMPWYALGSVSRPGPAEVAAILDQAVCLGVRWFDTGAAYGDAEDWLLCTPPAMHNLVTKVSPTLTRLGALQARRSDWLREPWRYVLLHNPTVEDLADEDVTRFFRGDRVGASVYAPEEARAAMAAGASVLQVPYCLLDRRHAEVIAQAKAAGVRVFARQPFLQGVLTNGAADWRSLSPETRLVVYRLWGLMDRFGVSRVEACLRFALDSGADHVVFGAGSLAHLREVVEVAGRPAPACWPECSAALAKAVSGVPPVEFSSLWRVPEPGSETAPK